MTGTSDWKSDISGTVVAYFSRGEDAQNAINELADEGIPVTEIGAAFHSNITPSTGAASTGNPRRPVHDEIPTMGSTASGAGVSGPESDTSGVTPAGLSTGSGTGFPGASRPGPIPGSEIPPELPREVPSALRSSSTAPLSESTGVTPAPAPAYADQGYRDDRSQPEASWWDKLKHLFSGEKSADPSVRRPPSSEAPSSKFGTGEGEIGIASEYDYPYSGSAFESSFTSMGVSPDRSRHLAREIRRGGAIVTVNAGSMIAKAEQILERNNGIIRYEGADVADETLETAAGPARVQIFGRVQHVYPDYISSAEPRRRAS